MTNKNLFVVVCVLVVMLNIVALAYLDGQTRDLKKKIVELESNRQQPLDIIYPQALDKNISTNLAEIDTRIKKIENALERNTIK